MGNKRKKIWIDRFQTTLAARIAGHFLLFQAAAVVLVLIARNYAGVLGAAGGPAAAVAGFLFVGVPLALLGGLFIYDAVRETHRVVGPLVRFRRAVKAVADGQELDLIRLREGDLLQDFQDEFNEMLQALERRGAVVLRKAEAEEGCKRPVPARV